VQEARPDEHAVCRLREQFQSDAFEGAHYIEPRLAARASVTDICGNGHRIVELKIPRQSAALIVPASAIIFNQNGMQVAVVENGVAHPRKIAITTDQGTEVEVNAGVQNGDQVILQPPVNLADGAKVQIIPEPPAATP
jgi:hypothetical protein